MLSILFIILFNFFLRSSSTEPKPRNLLVKNSAGAPIDVFYVRTANNELVKLSENPIRNSSELQINSYVGHVFVVKFSKGSGSIQGKFEKEKDEDEVVTVTYSNKRGFMIMKSTKVDEAMMYLQSSCDTLKDDSNKFIECVANMLNKNTKMFEDYRVELTQYRDKMAQRLRNYTCADLTLKTSPIISSSTYTVRDVKYTINTLFDGEHAKIWTVDNFITPEECAVLDEYATPRLKRATILAPDGSAMISDIRRAQQAEYDRLKNDPKDPLWDLYRRILKVTNHKAGYSMQPEGQETFAITQYNDGDEYVQHCDGACDAQPYRLGGRVATAVLYCKVAEEGGGTSFTKADIFVKPTVGMATFFSYKGADGLMDSGYTEHSGCPVLKGEKMIATLWMREGVSKQKPWSGWDPLGLPITYLLEAGVS